MASLPGSGATAIRKTYKVTGPLASEAWHRWELLVTVVSGVATIDWWVDGALHGHQTGVAFWPGSSGGIVSLGFVVATDPALQGWTGIGTESPDGTALDHL